jgi:two-component system nitrogen regulation sensor histidine kinase NtrY
MPAAPEPSRTPRSQRLRAGRVLLFGILALILVGLGGLLLKENADSFTWPYITNSVLLSFLFLTNAILVLTFVILLMRNLVKALMERRRGILGSRFRTKLVFSLLGLWLLPSGIIFWAALHLIQRSVDRWFNDPMDRFTETSQAIVDFYYDEARGRAAAFARVLADRAAAGGLGDREGPAAVTGTLESFRREYALDLVALDRPGEATRLVFAPHLEKRGGLNEVPHNLREQAAQGTPFTWVSEFLGGQMIRAGHPLPGGGAGGVITAGIFIQKDLMRMAAAVSRSNQDYRQIRAQKGLIKRVYVLVFALITLVVLFSVTWIGLYLARRITDPIQSLAQGTRAIMSGQLDYRVKVEAGDELGILVDSFNRMTAELESGRAILDRRTQELSASNRELMERRRYIETLLEEITAGVVSIDVAGRITTINRAARRLLGLAPGPDPVGRPLAPLLGGNVRAAMETLMNDLASGGERPAAHQVDLPAGGRVSTLALSAAALRDGTGAAAGTLLVIEDLSDLMRAQKIAAWQEVARRMAHEIKNPLTPIQLSAERIRKKYSERTGDLDAIVEEGTTAIVREVGALKNLVNEFSRFARLPAPQPVPTGIDAVIAAALALYDGIHPDVTLRSRCEAGLPPIPLDPEQIKRVLVNLVDNAIAAMGGHGTVEVTARRDADHGSLRIEVADDGPGIPPEDRDRLFLPYFSTKKKGTGLGLAIVHRIVTDHHGRITVEDNHPRGVRFVVELPGGPVAGGVAAAAAGRGGE